MLSAAKSLRQASRVPLNASEARFFMKKNNVRVFLSDETYERLLKWAAYYGYGLSRACRIIIDSAPLFVPEEIKEASVEDIKSLFDDQL